MRPQYFTIPGRLPGLNEIISANRSNHHCGAKLKRDSDDLVRMCIRKAGIKPMKRPVQVDFCWIEKSRARDKDNIRVGAKFVMDALVAEGVIPDDSQRFVEGFTDTYQVSKTNPRVVVTLTEV